MTSSKSVDPRLESILTGYQSGDKGYLGLDRDVYLRIVHHIEEALRSKYPYDGTPDERRAFFSDLDDSYRTPDIVDPILEWLWYPNLVLTGQFGHYVVERLKALRIKKNYLLYTGEIRSGKAPILLEEQFAFRPEVFTFTLLDDSFYSGRTRLALMKELWDKQFDLQTSVVIYNGCRRWNPQVNAIYHWYMVHGLEEFPVEGTIYRPSCPMDGAPGIQIGTVDANQFRAIIEYKCTVCGKRWKQTYSGPSGYRWEWV